MLNKKELIPENPNAHSEQSNSPRGILGVDYTIGEDMSDSSDSCDDEVGDLPGSHRNWPGVSAASASQPSPKPIPRKGGGIAAGARLGDLNARRKDDVLMATTLKKPLKHYMNR